MSQNEISSLAADKLKIISNVFHKIAILKLSTEVTLLYLTVFEQDSYEFLLLASKTGSSNKEALLVFI